MPAKLKCTVEGCDFVPPSGTESGLKHHITVKHSSGDPGTEIEVAGTVRQKPGRKSKLDGFILEQNLETAAAYVLAAKFPRGISVEDFPRVVRLVKAVEHG
jgi:hypothetical protein